MTNCSICNVPCPGHADTSNPCCEDCLVLSFSGTASQRTWLDDDPPPVALRRREQQQLARLLGAVAAHTRPSWPPGEPV